MRGHAQQLRATRPCRIRTAPAKSPWSPIGPRLGLSMLFLSPPVWYVSRAGAGNSDESSRVHGHTLSLVFSLLANHLTPVPSSTVGELAADASTRSASKHIRTEACPACHRGRACRAFSTTPLSISPRLSWVASWTRPPAPHRRWIPLGAIRV